MESKSILKRKAIQAGKGVNDIIVELSDEDRLAGHIPDEYYKLARNNNVFYEDKKMSKLVQILDLTEGEEEVGPTLQINRLKHTKYEKLLKEAEKLIALDPDKGTPEAERLDHICSIIKEYEEIYTFKKPKLLEAILFKIRERWGI